MPQLMISLDKKILDPQSAVARRMIQYGEKDSLHIIIPCSEKKEVQLSPQVRAVGSGAASKWRQWGRLYAMGEEYLKKNKVDIISAQDPFFIGLTAVWLGRQFHCPTEIQVHGDFYSSEYYRRSGGLNWMRFQIGKYVLRRANRVRVVGQRVKRSLIEKLGIAESKIILRPVSGRPPADAQFDLHQRYFQFNKIFVVIGRLDPVKNIPWLLGVFKLVTNQMPGCGLIIVGNGPQKLLLQKLAQNLRLDQQTIFTGWTDEVWSYMKTADAVLFPSLSEGYGLVPMEAVQAGAKVIMTDVGVANYELKPSDQVRIVPVGDKDAFIKEMFAV